jgi:hypothetical protein
VAVLAVVLVVAAVLAGILLVAQHLHLVNLFLSL